MNGNPALSVVVIGASAPQALAATLRNVALQRDIVFETVVVDGAADDGAILRNVLDLSRAPLISIVRAGDLLCPGALRTMIEGLEAAPLAGMAHAVALPLDAAGGVSREEAHARAFRLIARAQSSAGRPLGALPTFRREALRAHGDLTSTSLDDALAATARQIRAHGQALLIPRIVCARGQQASNLEWRARAASRLGRGRPWARNAIRRLARAARAAPITGLLLRLPGPYAVFGTLLQRWSLDGLRPLSRNEAPIGAERIAYVLWRYPALSETFIRREVQALRTSGMGLEVIALEPDDPPAPDDPRSPAGAVIYVGPQDEAAGRAAIVAHLKRHPWTVICLWLFVVGHRSRSQTTWWRDRNVLFLGGQLALTLADRGVTHVHAPWADSFSVVAFVASRLVGVTFSTQARASEIHRTMTAPLVADRLRCASFVITNSRYNERDLLARLGAVGVPPIHVVYNGVDLSRFRPAPRVAPEGRPLHLLSVGRLVEPKGLRNLLLACRRLRDRGLEFSCEIIGGGVEPTDTATWVELRVLLTGLGLEDVVRFRGPQSFSTVLAAFQRADFFVLPCVRGRDGSHDITPNALIEAMAMGLPVISTTSGAVPEIVDHGINGLLVPPNDIAALEDAIERLLDDVDLRQTLGAAARRTVQDRFDIDRNVPPRIALFRGLRTQLPGQSRAPEGERSPDGRA